MVVDKSAEREKLNKNESSEICSFKNESNETCSFRDENKLVVRSSYEIDFQDSFPQGLRSLASDLDRKVNNLDEVCKHLHNQCIDLEEQVEFAYERYGELYCNLSDERESKSSLQVEKEKLEQNSLALRVELDQTKRENEEMKEQVSNFEDVIQEQIQTFDKKCNVLVGECKHLEELIEAGAKEKSDLQKQLNAEIRVNNEFGERIILLEKRNESYMKKIEKKTDAYRHLKQAYAEDKKKWEMRDQCNRNYIQELEDKLKLSCERFTSTGDEVAMIVAWANKLRKTLNDSKDVARTCGTPCSSIMSGNKGNDIFVNRASAGTTPTSLGDPILLHSLSIESNRSSSRACEASPGGIKPKIHKGSPPRQLLNINTDLLPPTSPSQELLQLAQGKVEMQRRLMLINDMKEGRDIMDETSSKDDDTEFDVWNQEHINGAESFVTTD